MDKKNNECSPRHIAQELRHTNNLIKRRLCEITSEPAPYMTGEQGMMLRYITLAGDTDVFQRDVERNFKIRRSTATVLLQTMETNRLIRRETVGYDARLKKIVLTELGKRVEQELEAQFAAIETRMVRNISPQEQEAFFSILIKINQNLGGDENTDFPLRHEKFNSCQGGHQE